MPAAAFSWRRCWWYPQLVEEATVTAYDLRITSEDFRARARRQAVVANLVGSAAVVLAVSIGLPLKELAGGAVRTLLLQVALGTAVGVALLASALAAYTASAARGRVRLAPELDRHALVHAGQTWRHVISVSVQSAVSEESWCRLLVGAAVWLRTGSAVAGVVAGTAVWVAMHDLGGVIPRWARRVELLALGCVYGALMVTVGLVSAIVAHAVFNALMLGWPLMRRERSPA